MIHALFTAAPLTILAVPLMILYRLSEWAISPAANSATMVRAPSVARMMAWKLLPV